MATLVARGVVASYADMPVLHGVDVTVGPRVRLGLVGPNGAGKSTLLRVLAGRQPAEAGTVTASGTIGYLEQEPERHEGETLLAALARRTGVGPADTAMQASAAVLDGGGDRAAQAYTDALQVWLDLGGGDFDARAAQVCSDLGLDPSLLTASTSALSGGQLARASLAAVLLSRVDVLLLDEPTNDLDLDGLDRLESFVSGLRGGLLVVSHDREFLSRTVTGVLELDPLERTSTTYAGGWEAYLAEREVDQRHARERYDNYAEQRSALAGQVQSVRELSVRGAVRAKRRAPDNDRSAKGARIEGATSAAGKVRNLENRLARLDSAGVDEPRKKWRLELQLPAAARSGDVVATLRGAVVGRGSFTLGPVDLDLRYADRVAILGPNGGGKTTLLSVVLGRLPITSGTASLGAGVVVGELDQVRSAFTGEAGVVAVVLAGSDLAEEEARTLLAKFGLRGQHAVRPAGSLSPGERTRAALALLMARGTNLLVLDEPTNHLDLPAIEQLEQALDTYPGTLLLVSHDRRLLQAVRVSRRLTVAAGRVTES